MSKLYGWGIKPDKQATTAFLEATTVSPRYSYNSEYFRGNRGSPLRIVRRWKPAWSGGRTRARTWDPLIKSRFSSSSKTSHHLSRTIA